MKRLMTTLTLSLAIACTGSGPGGDEPASAALNDQFTSGSADETDGGTSGAHNGEVGHWTFEGNFIDSAGKRLDLTAGTDSQFVSGPVGQALYGSASRPKPDAEFDFGTDDFAIMCWTSGDVGLHKLNPQHSCSNGDTGWTVRMSTGGSHPTALPGIDGCFGSASFFSTATQSAKARSKNVQGWHHFAFVRRAGTFEAWVNGELIKSVPGNSMSLGSADQPLVVDGPGDGRGNFKALVDELVILRRAPSPEEIAKAALQTP